MGNLLSSKKKKIQLEQKRFGYEKDIKTKEFELNKLKHCFQERTSQLSIADEELDDQLNRARSELQTLKQEYDAAQEAAKDPVEIVYLKASLENLQKNMQETFNEIKERRDVLISLHAQKSDLMDQKLLNEYTELYNDIVTMESLSQYEKLDSGENNSFDGVGGGSRAKRAPRRSMRRGHSVRLKRQKA